MPPAPPRLAQPRPRLLPEVPSAPPKEPNLGLFGVFQKSLPSAQRVASGLHVRRRRRRDRSLAPMQSPPPPDAAAGARAPRGQVALEDQLHGLHGSRACRYFIKQVVSHADF
ncbi:uncharacterized protein [Penaeus vannamei]|uniref:uncharacterized protein n=1 Tax=Penaeus vannamei TaxID=6689 RepID=UPI00387FACFF